MCGAFSEYATLANKQYLLQEARKPKWLIENFLMQGSLNMIYASAGVGKSILCLELAHFLAKNASISKVIYFDGDNSETTLFTRGLNEVIESSGTKLEYYFVKKNKFSLINTPKKL